MAPLASVTTPVITARSASCACDCCWLNHTKAINRENAEMPQRFIWRLPYLRATPSGPLRKPFLRWMELLQLVHCDCQANSFVLNQIFAVSGFVTEIVDLEPPRRSFL